MPQVQAHSAAVKALAWCPYQSNLLATGGGTADRHIRFWNTHTCAMLSAIDTGSQVRAGLEAGRPGVWKRERTPPLQLALSPAAVPHARGVVWMGCVVVIEG